MDSVTLKLINDGEIRLIAERAGFNNGYQRMSVGIDHSGNTQKTYS